VEECWEADGWVIHFAIDQAATTRNGRPGVREEERRNVILSNIIAIAPPALYSSLAHVMNGGWGFSTFSFLPLPKILYYERVLSFCVIFVGKWEPGSNNRTHVVVVLYFYL
jgi:hypothetical protein